jgi:hypothetical protein
MEPENDTTSAVDILTGGGKPQLGAGGGSGATGNTAVVEIATPQSGASGGSTVESGDTGGTAPAAAAASENPPAATTDSTNAPAAAAGTDANAGGNGATASTDPNAKPADNPNTAKESTSKKKKGLKKIIPW